MFCAKEKWREFKMPKRKQIPTFKSENKEREFWTKKDSTGYIDWNKARRADFPELKAGRKRAIKGRGLK
jgi:hypothetical protein